MEDIRNHIFAPIQDRIFRAALICEHEGCLSGVSQAVEAAAEIGVSCHWRKAEGDRLAPGEMIGYLAAAPKQIAIAEERIIGALAKFSGVATAARRAVELAGGNLRIVSGSWKKMPSAIKDGIRAAVLAGGADFRICELPMIYLDKNYIRMLGSIPAALAAVASFAGHNKVVQIRGEGCSVAQETVQAVEHGCNILMVDTGTIGDLRECAKTVRRLGRRDKVRLAFAGGVRIADIPLYLREDLDTLCIGKEIVDAPLLDMKLDVVANGEEARKWA